MIKRIRFAPPVDHAGRTASSADVRAMAAHRLSAPPDARPLRATVAETLVGLSPDVPHPSVLIEFFDGTAHLARCEAWLANGPVGDVDPGIVIIAEERVVRGADWLDERWADGGPRLKQMAIAGRRAGLTRAEFAELWRSRAGSVGAVPIPEEARGKAYVQNHPVADREPAYDAVNEVYFDSREELLTRMAWMAEALTRDGENDLIDRNWFLALTEEPVIPGTRQPED